jgi:hypothetical protein
MKAEDIREWDETEIHARLKELKEEHLDDPARHRAPEDSSSRA